MKTKLTKEIEYSLIKKYCVGTFNDNYGALEVPVDYTFGKGNQNIDFALYKANKQDISCFEIKMTKSDFNSKASLITSQQDTHHFNGVRNGPPI